MWMRGTCLLRMRAAGLTHKGHDWVESGATRNLAIQKQARTLWRDLVDEGGKRLRVEIVFAFQLEAATKRVHMKSKSDTCTTKEVPMTMSKSHLSKSESLVGSPFMGFIPARS